MGQTRITDPDPEINLQATESGYCKSLYREERKARGEKPIKNLSVPSALRGEEFQYMLEEKPFHRAATLLWTVV